VAGRARLWQLPAVPEGHLPPVLGAQEGGGGGRGNPQADGAGKAEVRPAAGQAGKIAPPWMRQWQAVGG